MNKIFYIIMMFIAVILVLGYIENYIELGVVIFSILVLLVLSVSLYLNLHQNQVEKPTVRLRFDDVLTKTCPTCNTENNINRVYCKQCNSPIKNIICPVCQTKNPFDQKYCTNCDSILQNRKS